MTPEPFHAGIRETALRNMLRAPEDLAYPLVTDLHDRPVTMEVISAQPSGRLQKVFSGLLLFPGLLFLILGIIEGNLALIIITLFFCALVGLVFWINAARSNMLWRISWQDDTVEVTDQRWGRNSHWSAPYTAFTGIAVRKNRIMRNRSGSPRTAVPIQVTELVHQNPQKTLLLGSCDPCRGVETRARASAQHIGVPFLGGKTW